MIFYLYATVLSFLIKELALLIDLSHHSDLSLKEYFDLESRYHPSMLVRFFFRYIYKKLEQGMSLTQVGSHFGFSFDSPFITIEHFQKIFYLLSQSHPCPYPYMSLFRFLIVSVFAYSQKILSLYDEKMILVLLLCCMVFYEWWSWLDYRVYIAKLFMTSTDPKKDMQFIDSIPSPQYLRTRYEKNMWKDLYQISHSLDKTLMLYQYYWGVFKKRDCVSRRRYIGAIIDIAMLIFFVMTLVLLLEQSYQPYL